MDAMDALFSKELSLSATKITSGVEETINIGMQFANSLQPNDVIILEGNLGTGKTQFIKGVAIGLGITDKITSPTFNIVLSYAGKSLVLNHFDLYRLEDESQLEDVDYFATLESGGVCAVEWGTKFCSAVPEDCVVIEMAYIANDNFARDKREINFYAKGARGKELLDNFFLEA